MTKFTKKAIIQAFQNMLRKIPFDKITVSAIAKECGISTNTFYYHFADIYDLLDKWLDINKSILIAIPLKRQGWQDVLKNLLLTMRKNSDIIYHLFGSISRERLERCIFTSTDDTFRKIISKSLSEAEPSEDDINATATYFGYCILGFIIKFIWSGMDMDIDESVNKLSEIMTAASEGYINGNRDKP